MGAFTHGRLKRVTKQISNHWLGILLYLSLFLLLSDLIRSILFLATGRPLFSFSWNSKPIDAASRAATVIGDALVFAATALLSVYGIFHARQVKNVTYPVTIHKNCGFTGATGRKSRTESTRKSRPDTAAKSHDGIHLKIALVADLHLGYSVILSQIRKIADIIREMEPDLIILAGDIFDNEFTAIKQPEECARVLASLKSTYGSFACWGNHDVEELIFAGFTFHSKEEKVFGSPQMNQFLEASGIRVSRTGCDRRRSSALRPHTQRSAVPDQSHHPHWLKKYACMENFASEI
ncbi:MAG: metallophosphoesterase [Lachnospiraceae bacterium]|nr:metallophosphoesterase [Lachnospiraceae bacterium]